MPRGPTCPRRQTRRRPTPRRALGATRRRPTRACGFGTSSRRASERRAAPGLAPRKPPAIYEADTVVDGANPCRVYTFRAIRLELRLRQSDLAARAGVCQQTISNLEGGRFGSLSSDTLCAVAEALQADLSLVVRWRGPKLARLLDRRHARLQDRVVELLAGAGWTTCVEESFNHYGERGSVDILAWRPDRRALLIVEIKSELVDLQETVRTMDVKARVVPIVVRRTRGWDAHATASILVLPEARVHRRVVAQHSALLAAALPARTVAVRHWIADPSGNVRGVWFLANTPHHGAGRPDPPTRRVSRRRPAPVRARVLRIQAD
jgi:transcriptional regulator with XRE-family HTH domain